jgi:hypothetical protein
LQRQEPSQDFFSVLALKQATPVIPIVFASDPIMAWSSMALQGAVHLAPHGADLQYTDIDSASRLKKRVERAERDDSSEKSSFPRATLPLVQ